MLIACALKSLVDEQEESEHRKLCSYADFFSPSVPSFRDVFYGRTYQFFERVLRTSGLGNDLFLCIGGNRKWNE